MSGAIASAYGNRFAGQPSHTPTASLTTPTYEGSGETTEPTWIPKPSWVTAVGTDLLAHNPLPGGDPDYENPSLLISNDYGATWTTPPGLTNPIAPSQTGVGGAGNNADCFLMADPNANRLIMWFCSDGNPPVGGVNQAGFWYSICTDPSLVTWSAPVQHFSLNGGNFAAGEQEPKFIWNPLRNRYWMWTHQDPTDIMRFRESLTTNPVGAYTSATVCELVLPGEPTGVWHMDIIRETSGRLIMVICDSHVNGVLQRQGWLASSYDGIRWKAAPRPFMKANSWAVSGIYRPSIVPSRTGTGYDIITSRHQNPSARLGLVRNVPATEIP